MATGVLIAESMRPGSAVMDIQVTVTSIRRATPTSVTAGQPPIWTVIAFEVADGEVSQLARKLAVALDAPSWYVALHTQADTLIVLPGRVLRYRRGDEYGRRAAQLAAHKAGVAQSALDWEE